MCFPKAATEFSGGVIDKRCSRTCALSRRFKCRGELGQDTFSHATAEVHPGCCHERRAAANHATVATTGRHDRGVCLAITTTVILINSPVDAISTLPRSMDGRHRRSVVRSAKEGSLPCLRLLPRLYTY